MTIEKSLRLIGDINVEVTIELGRTTMTLEKLMSLSVDSVLMLDRLTDEPLDMLVNGKRVARGEVINQGNRFGFRILEMVGSPSGLPGAEPKIVPDVAVQKEAS